MAALDPHSVFNYICVRSLELEGRHPDDAGAWLVTVKRMEAGEGIPTQDMLPHDIHFSPGEPLPPAPRINPDLLATERIPYYRRIRSSEDAEAFLRVHNSSEIVALATLLFPEWTAPEEGILPVPQPNQRPLQMAHVVPLVQAVPRTRRFVFLNSWGKKWGYQGNGMIPYEYIDRYAIECWVGYNHLTELSSKTSDTDGTTFHRFNATTADRLRVYGFDVLQGRQRCGWAFVTERDGALEMEDLYVRPEFRRLGYGRFLAAQVKQLAAGKQMTLNAWIPFADCRRENPSNYDALVATSCHLGLTYYPCPVPWAAYFGSTDRRAAGSDRPVEPAAIPPRPRAALDMVFAAALAAAEPNGEPSSNGSMSVAAATSLHDFPNVGTEEWGAMNRRRAELIRKKVRGQLIEADQAEYERLQHLSLAAIESAFPRTGGEERAPRLPSEAPEG